MGNEIILILIGGGLTLLGSLVQFMLSLIADNRRREKQRKNELAIFRDEMIREDFQSVHHMLDQMGNFLAIVNKLASAARVHLPINKDKDQRALLEELERMGSVINPAMISIQSMESKHLYESFDVFILMFGQIERVLLGKRWEEASDIQMLILSSMAGMKKAIRDYRYDVRSGTHLLDNIV